MSAACPQAGGCGGGGVVVVVVVVFVGCGAAASRGAGAASMPASTAVVCEASGLSSMVVFVPMLLVSTGVVAGTLGPCSTEVPPDCCCGPVANPGAATAGDASVAERPLNGPCPVCTETPCLLPAEVPGLLACERSAVDPRTAPKVPALLI